jgi:hypothetical protein
MKKILLILIVVVGFSVQAQEKYSFERKFYKASMYSFEFDAWSPTIDVDVTVVFNYEESENVALFIEDKKSVLFPLEEKIFIGITKDSVKYQRMKYLDGDGKFVTLVLYDDGDVMFIPEQDIPLLFLAEILKK